MGFQTREARGARSVAWAAVLLLVVTATGATAQTRAELAGRSLGSYPLFEFVRSLNSDEQVEVAVDTSRFPALSGETADIYVLETRNFWLLGSALVDVTGSPVTFGFSGAGISANRVVVAGPGELPSDAGTDVGVGYDVVIDVDQNGLLDAGDFLDNEFGEAGFYAVKDLTTAGPLAVSSGNYSVSGTTAGFDEERVFYPSDIAQLGSLPLVIISHGNGHNYTWYDYLQSHLASHGYIVMSHENNTGPGVFNASTTTLEHTDAMLGQQDTILGGVLDGHIDSSRITWIGHSRGGEGVAIAYDRIFDGGWNPVNYDLDDIAVISSIAPTDFLAISQTDPHDATFHLLYGSADGDVCGCPSLELAWSFNLLERATGCRQSTYVHGADHNDFNCCGFDDFSGPPGTAIGRTEAQQVTKATYLALIEHHVDNGFAAKDYLWRQWESFKPIGVASTTTVVSEFRENPDSGKFVVDDYQTNPATDMSSSGAGVRVRVNNLIEGLMIEDDGVFTWLVTDPFNGMTRNRTSDFEDGVVFDVEGTGTNESLMWSVAQAQADFSQFEFLSFRAAQGTRHPLTTTRLQDESWTIALIDRNRVQSRIDFSVYGGGIEEPYQRTGFGSGAGWQNEFETVRIRLTDFTTNRPNFDLTNVRRIAFVFTGSSGPTIGRIAIDDLELTTD